jgi:hypothetical protein
MRGPRSEDDRVFEVSDGDWVPSTDLGPTHREKQRDPEALDAARAVTELRAELAVLRASHARLRDRVVALEAAQSGTAAPNGRQPRGSRSRRRSEPPGAFAEAPPAHEPLANNPGFAATQASPGLPGVGAAPSPAPAVAAPGPVAARPEARAAPLPPSIEDMARALVGEQLPTVLGVPGLQSITDCLAMLVGTAPSLETTAAVPFDQVHSGHVCKLLDDDGRERGAIILDLKAAVMLGAALLALPREEAERQVQAADPSEDALLATSEICNNLTGPINAVSGNAHVRSTALVPLTPSEAEKLPASRQRLDLLVEGGRLVLAMF